MDSCFRHSDKTLIQCFTHVINVAGKFSMARHETQRGCRVAVDRVTIRRFRQLTCTSVIAIVCY